MAINFKLKSKLVDKVHFEEFKLSKSAKAIYKTSYNENKFRVFNNPSTIYVRVIDGRNADVMVSTGKNINPKDWSLKTEFPKSNSDNNKNLITKLKDIEKDIFNSLNERKPGEQINGQWVKDIINPPKEKKGAPDELVKFIEENFINDKKRSGASESTIKKINVNKALLERMQADRKQPILINEIDFNFQNDFHQYCESEGYAIGTIARALKYVKTACLHAKRFYNKDVPEILPELKIEIPETDALPIYLTFDELEKIKAANIDKEKLQITRDWLIISCYTGQRVSDFMRFNSKMLRKDKDHLLIEFRQQKTKKKIAIPAHNEVIKILKKRGGKFPRKISDQKYNDYLKELCKIAGIDEKIKGSKRSIKTNRKEESIYFKYELISSHVGRRSFSSNFYGTVPTSILRVFTGHSTEKQFLEYIGKTETDQAKAIIKFW